MSKAKIELKRYTSYDWGRLDHDPMIDRMATVMEREGLSVAKVSQLSGLSQTTLRNWFDRGIRGKRKPTIRPMFSSVMAFLRGTGHDLQIIKPSRAASPSATIRFARNVAAKANTHSGSSAHH